MVVPSGSGARVRRRAGLAGALWLVTLSVLAVPADAQQTHLLVVTGLEGDAEHGDQFFEWASGLVETARTTFEMSADQVTYLSDTPDRDPELIDGPATRDAIDQAIADIAARAEPEDTVFIVLFGHGTSDGRDPRFNLRGPDLSAGDFAARLEGLSVERVVFVNTTSASGEFVEALAGPGRTVLTATRRAAEHFDTKFGGFFAEAFGSDAADTNKDRRVSVLEAFNYARNQVERSFEQDGLLQTEHALLDDDGDGEGVQEPDQQQPDGRTSATLYLGIPPARTASGAPIADPALKALYEERLALERQIADLTLVKDVMPPDKYEAELERLATALALKNRDIRQREEQE